VKRKKKTEMERALGEAATYAGLTAFIDQCARTLRNYELGREMKIHGKRWQAEWARRKVQ
jgi:hypothetical protein